jgi:S1-C subfamily serine protease
LYFGMTVLDWGIVAFTLALAIWGYEQGLIVGAFTLTGFTLGAFAGSRLAPALLSGGSHSPYAPLLAALGALMFGAAVAVSLEGLGAGVRARLIHGPTLHLADGAGGAVLIAAVALGLTWIFGAVALHAPGAAELRRDVQRSLILGHLNDLLPPSGPILNALNRVDPRASVPGPPASVGPPSKAIVSDPEVARAGGSVVKVLGTACGLGVEGSGWMAAPGLVVTNAHVVAGESDTTVSAPDGTKVDATPVHYEPINDLAVLRVDLNLPALPMARNPSPGTSAAVIGYPENGGLTISPARFGGTQSVISEDSYGRGPVTRQMSSIRGAIRSGDSGGPVVDMKGRVLATIFAATTTGKPGGFAIPGNLVRSAISNSSGPVGTGACTAG